MSGKGDDYDKWLLHHLRSAEFATRYLGEMLHPEPGDTDEQFRQDLSNALIRIGKAHGVALKEAIDER